MDGEADAVEKLQELKKKDPHIVSVYHSWMQSFLFTKQYDGIFMWWCIGYLKKEELIAFLRKARDHLRQPEGK